MLCTAFFNTTCRSKLVVRWAVTHETDTNLRDNYRLFPPHNSTECYMHLEFSNYENYEYLLCQAYVCGHKGNCLRPQYHTIQLMHDVSSS